MSIRQSGSDFHCSEKSVVSIETNVGIGIGYIVMQDSERELLEVK